MNELHFSFLLSLLIALYLSLLTAFVLKDCLLRTLLAIQRTSPRRLRADQLPNLSLLTRLRIISQAFLHQQPLNYEARGVTIRNNQIQIDYKLAVIIGRLNHSGIETTYCCQGCHTPADVEQSKLIGLHGHSAFVIFHPTTEFPPALVSALIRSGLPWTIGRHTLATLDAYTYHEELFAINITFLALLEDWADDKLDPTGDKYHKLYDRQLQTLFTQNRPRATQTLCKYCSTQAALNNRESK